MECKRCGKSLPNEGYMCTNCGKLIENNQIKIQKELNKSNINIRPEFISEKYGYQKQIFQQREKINKKPFALLFILIILLIISFIAIIVYFF